MNKKRRKRRASFVEPGGPQLPTSYTPLQVAKALQVSRQSVTRRCQSGVIKAVKIGDLWRIPHPEVERLLGQEIVVAG